MITMGSSISFTRWTVQAGNSSICPAAAACIPTSKDTVEKKMHFVHQDGQQVFKFAVRKQTEFA